MKLPRISGEGLIKKLRRAGFIVVRQKGSHVRLEKREGENIIKLTVPMHSELKKGTLHQILKEASVSIKDLENL